MSKTAAEMGWHASRYNLFAEIPGTEKAAVANLFRGTCGEYTPIELYLLDELDDLDQEHPILRRFRERGLIVNFDEREALEAKGRMACAGGQSVGLTICPTMGCNFDCPYCFEKHRSGKMSDAVQESLLSLTERMLGLAGAKRLSVTWFGGEPLLRPEIIESLSEKLIPLAEKHGADYSAEIITNGYLLSQPIADMLHRYKVKSAQITLDGVGAEHDATRHLAGGGATFDRISENLRTLQLPFSVYIRHNVHEGNLDQVGVLRNYVRKLADESGNEIRYYPAAVSANIVSEEKSRQIRLLCGSEAGEIGIVRDANRLSCGRGHFCGAQLLTSVVVDEQGRLFKCWEDADKPEHSFGSAERWDPADPIGTADSPDNLVRYLNSALPSCDEECRECVWLPLCAGGCPNKRLYGEKACVPYKNEPEKFALKLCEKIEEKRNKG